MFDQLTGNDHVKQLLRRMLESRRVPGALLFSGEDGIGKKLFALELARSLNCRSRKGVEACGECSICLRTFELNVPDSRDQDILEQIIWTNHRDVGMVVAPGRVLKVVQMRTIEREANYRPFEGAARVFLVDDADKFNDASANALLKVLEEPPPTSHIILITSRPAMLLPTIRSRCQVIRFSPLTAEEIEKHLLAKKLAKPAEARLRARTAGGSLARALSGDLETFQERREAMLQVLSAVAISGDRSRLLRLAEEMNDASHKDDYEISLEILEALTRDALMVSLGLDSKRLVNEDLSAQLGKIAERIDSQKVINWISQIEEVREQLKVNINRKPATDALFLSMASA